MFWYCDPPMTGKEKTVPCCRWVPLKTTVLSGTAEMEVFRSSGCYRLVLSSSSLPTQSLRGGHTKLPNTQSMMSPGLWSKCLMPTSSWALSRSPGTSQSSPWSNRSSPRRTQWNRGGQQITPWAVSIEQSLRRLVGYWPLCGETVSVQGCTTAVLDRLWNRLGLRSSVEWP